MKKILRLAFAILGLVALTTPTQAEVGDTWKSGGLWYRELTANSVAVIPVPEGDETVYTGAINIPPSVGHDVKTFTVTHIADSAFMYTSIYEVTLPGSLQEIGLAAFYGAHLEDLEFPRSPMLQKIGNGAFGNNKQLETVTFTNLCKPQFNPLSVFIDCDALKSFIVEPGNSSYSTFDGVLYDKVGKKLLMCPKAKDTITFNEACEEISELAFYNCSIKSLYIPETIKKIGERAFEDCENLTDVFTGDNVETIPEMCFFGAGSLNVTLGKNTKYIGNSCFEFSDVQIVKWNEGLKTIGSLAFNYTDFMYPTISSNSRKLVLPESVDSIGYMAFAGCGMTEVTINPSIKYGMQVFKSCNSLMTVKIQEGVKELSAGLFMLCPFYNISLPASLEKIGKNAFQQCSQLRKIEVSPASPYFTVDNYVLFTKDMKKLVLCPAQGQYMKDTKYIIPEGVTEIETAAFATNSFIQELIFPASLETINALSCGRMTELRTVDLSKTKITEISERVFDSSSELKKVLLPDGLEAIKEEAFNACENITEFQFPKNLKLIGKNAFKRAFDFIPIALPEGLDSIGYHAFYQAALKDKVIIPSTVTKWGKESFMYSGGYEEVSVNTKVPIPINSFYGVYGLQKVNIGSDVPGLDDGTFFISSPYETIKEFNFAEGIKYMGMYNLPGAYEKITLPNSMEIIGFSNFRNEVLKTLILGSGTKSIEYIGTTPQLENLVCLATEPPVVHYEEDYYDEYKNIVAEYLYPLATLYVPDESVEAYKKADIWKKFSVIAPYTEYLNKVSGVDEIENALEETISVDGLTIVPSITNGYMNVADLAGKNIYSGNVTEVTVPDSGVYVVTVNGKRYKIAVR